MSRGFFKSPQQLPWVMAANKTAFQIWAVDAATPTIVGARSVLRVKTTTPAAGEKIAL